VFTVSEKTATSDIATEFTPTRVELPDSGLNERGRRELVRGLEAEAGFAHMALPMGGTGLTLIANGQLTPAGDDYKHAVYEHGQAAGPGDRIVITSMDIKGDRIVFDINGGPYLKHRFLRHVAIDGMRVVPDDGLDRATGARVTLLFEGGVPDLSPAEVKALLAPVLDFGVKTGEQAYADTLPAPVKNAIAAHEVLVGMNRRMVLAALGAPESKVREHTADGSGLRYEEWIYGHLPQTIKFVRFEGDRVTLLKIAAVGKPIEIHDKNEMTGWVDPSLTREIPHGDERADADHPVVPPTLAKPGEQFPNEVRTAGKVQYPTGTSQGGIPPLPDATGTTPVALPGTPPVDVDKP
jgi:hypothetical protein